MRNYMKKFTKKKALSWILMASIAVSLFAGLPQKVLAATADGIPATSDFKVLGSPSDSDPGVAAASGGVGVRFNDGGWTYRRVTAKHTNSPDLSAGSLSNGVRVDIRNMTVPSGGAISIAVGYDIGGKYDLYGNKASGDTDGDPLYFLSYGADGTFVILRNCTTSETCSVCGEAGVGVLATGGASLPAISTLGRISVYAKVAATGGTIVVDVYDKNDKFVQSHTATLPAFCRTEYYYNLRMAFSGGISGPTDRAGIYYSKKSVSYDISYMNRMFDASVQVGKGCDGVTELPLTIPVANGAILPIGYFSDANSAKYIKGWKLGEETLSNNKLGNSIITYSAPTNLTADFVDLSMLEVTAQKATDPENEGKKIVRFLSTVNEDLTDYKKAGIILYNAEGEFDVETEGISLHETRTVYNTVKANGAEFTASSIGGYTTYSEFVFGRVFNKVPENAVVYARAYVQLQNGSYVYGDIKEVNVADLQEPSVTQ